MHLVEAVYPRQVKYCQKDKLAFLSSQGADINANFFMFHIYNIIEKFSSGYNKRKRILSTQLQI